MGVCKQCGGVKEFGARIYCHSCRAGLDYFPKNLTAAQRLELFNIVKVEKPREKPPEKELKCPCEWGRNTGGRVVCMFRHCVKRDGFDYGVTR